MLYYAGWFAIATSSRDIDDAAITLYCMYTSNLQQVSESRINLPRLVGDVLVSVDQLHSRQRAVWGQPREQGQMVVYNILLCLNGRPLNSSRANEPRRCARGG